MLGYSAFCSAQTTAPSLQSLSGEIQKLYQRAQRQTVRVNVPVHLPTRLLSQAPELSKLDPKIREQLAQAKARGETRRIFIEPRASTQPTSAGAEQARIPLPTETAIINVEFIGLILDRQGDVLVPLYIDASYLDGPLQVTMDDRQATTAVVVASDRQTSLTVVRLAQPSGEPVQFAANRPSGGALMLMLSPTRRAARLGVWSGTADENAILLTLSGDVAGIVRNGHALYPSMFRPIVDQLVAGGPVKRAQLGLLIQEVAGDDPVRTKVSALGGRPAARVLEVMPGTPAAKAGVALGDLILSLGDEPVEDVTTFAAVIANCRGKTDLHILRGQHEQTISVDLQSN